MQDTTTTRETAMIGFTEDTTSDTVAAYRARGFADFTAITVHRAAIGYVWFQKSVWVAAYEDVSVAAYAGTKAGAVRVILEAVEAESYMYM